MSVAIRLSLTGKTHAISYRIAVLEKWSKRDGKCIEELGFYNPQQREGDRFKIKKERYDYWLSKGAQPSVAVEELVSTNGNPKPKPKKVRPVKEAATQPAQAPAAEAAAPAQAATPAEPKAEEPKTEAAPEAKEEPKSE